VAIADVFDALCTPRPYKPAWPLEQVLQTLREGAGSHFDARLLGLFLDILPTILEIRQRWQAPQPGPSWHSDFAPL
jgi:putative two-component system response regulator